MIEYRETPDGLVPEQLVGFFVGWPNPPLPETHLRILHGSSHIVLACDHNQVVGFITAVSDGVLAAYIPLLEVLPEYQHQGIGSELVRRMLGQLNGLYMIDLTWYPEKQRYYERFGFSRMTAMMRRDVTAQSGRQKMDQ